MRRFWFLLLVVILLTNPANIVLAANQQPTASDWAIFKEEMSKVNQLLKKSKNDAYQQLIKTKQNYEHKFTEQAVASNSVKLQIDSAWTAAANAVQNGEKLRLAIETEIIEKTTLALVYTTFKTKLTENKINQAWDWFSIMASQFKLNSKQELVKQMQQIRTKTTVSEKAINKLVNGLAVFFTNKVAEEIDEALEAASAANGRPDLAEAQIKAAEGVGYYQSIKSFSEQKLGYKDAALLEGLLNQIKNQIADNDITKARQAAEVLKEELAELTSTKQLSDTDLTQSINKIKKILTHVGQEIKKGELNQAKNLANDAWNSFTKIEGEIRRLDVTRYVKIEKIFPKIQEHPSEEDVQELKDIFSQVLAVKSGQETVARAPLDEIVVTGFENIQPFFFALLALLGIYPLYLIIKAFGWGHRAWRNIGIFIILLIVPVFMEAFGRLGVEFKITSLQALSFTVNEYAKMVWALMVLAAFLFAINGLRQFCSQFGVKAIGVRQQIEQPAAKTEPLS